jgi:hypothetical protein
VGGYVENLVLDKGPLTDYVIAFSVGTDLPRGIIISEWSFKGPWGHEICWDYEPFGMLPPNRKNSYAHLFKPRLLAVLNERRLLARGRPVEGLLCGRASQPIPEGIEPLKPIDGTLSLTDDTGRTTSRRMSLTVDRSMAPKPIDATRTRIRRLANERDQIPVKPSSLVRPAPAVPIQSEPPKIDYDSPLVQGLLAAYESGRDALRKGK